MEIDEYIQFPRRGNNVGQHRLAGGFDFLISSPEAGVPAAVGVDCDVVHGPTT